MSQATNCRFCGKTFSTTYQCSVHKKLHAFKCSDCAKEFYSNADLRQHVIDHVEFKRHCKTCNQTLTGEESYASHRDMHDNITYYETKKYACDNCGRLYEYKKAFRKHRSKCDSKPCQLQCDFCSAKPFTRKFDLEQHVRIHTSEYSFICNYCNKGFLRRSQLLVHLRSHFITVNDYPFQCKVCGATFASQYNLKRHTLRVHSEVKPVVDIQETVVTDDVWERDYVDEQKTEYSLLIGLEIEMMGE